MKHSTGRNTNYCQIYTKISIADAVPHLPVDLHVVGQHGMTSELPLALLTHQIWFLTILQLTNFVAVLLIVWLQLSLQQGEITLLTPMTWISFPHN